jgi:hypothetical protein
VPEQGFGEAVTNSFFCEVAEEFSLGSTHFVQSFRIYLFALPRRYPYSRFFDTSVFFVLCDTLFS